MVSATDIDAHVDAGQDDRDTGRNGERQTYPGPEKHSTRECNVPSPADAPACRCGGCDGCAVRSGNGSNLKAAQSAEPCRQTRSALPCCLGRLDRGTVIPCAHPNAGYSEGDRKKRKTAQAGHSYFAPSVAPPKKKAKKK